MALDDLFDWLNPVVDQLPADLGDLGSGVLEGASGGLSGALGAGGGLLSGLVDWAKANPQLAGALFGASGPLAGLIGNLMSGGQTGNTSGSTNTFGNTTQNINNTGFQNQNTTGSTTQNSTQDNTNTGYSNTGITPTIDPAAQGAMDRLTGMLSQNAGGAQGAYDQGLGMLSKLATGQMSALNGGTGATALPGPNTTPSPAAVTGFPSELPTTYNAGIGNLVKQAFGSFVGDLGSQAITNARQRGFAGGGDLLGSAAAPMMGQSLAQVPAMEAKAYLDHVLQAYDLQSQNAGRENSARAGALNAATNALGPGVSKYGMDVQKYGIDRSQDNAQIGQLTSLLTSLMQPNRDLMTGNLGLLNAAPRGSQQNTLTGGQSNQTLSGATTSQGTNQQTSGSQQQTQGTTQGGTNTSGTTGVPLPNSLAQAIASIIGGAGQGAVAGGPPPPAGTDFASLLKYLQGLGKA